MDQTDLIALLNDIAADDPVLSSTGVYFNADGQPTDRFLEALKDDLGKLPDFPDYNEFQKKRIPTTIERERDPVDGTLPSNSTNQPKSRVSTAVDHPPSPPPKAAQQVVHTSIPVYLPQPRRTPKDLKRGHCREGPVLYDDPCSDSEDSTSIASSAEHFSSHDKTKEISPLHHVTKSHLIENLSPQQSEAKKNLSKKSIANAEALVTKKSKTESSSTTTATKKKAVHKVQLTEFPPHQQAVRLSKSTNLLTVADVDDVDQVLIDKEGKIKSLQLRLRGQLQTIKTLENQLLEAQGIIESKSKQVSMLVNKLRAVGEVQQKHDQAQRVIEDSKALIEIVDQLKKQLASVTTKLSDETTKRHKAEERAKMLKEYADTAKSRCGSIESQNTELKAAITELQNKIGKYRKSYRDIASDVNSHRNQISQKDNEIAKLQKRAEQSEQDATRLKKELQKCMADLKSLQVENKQKTDTIRNMQLQLDIQQERELVKRTESRLKANSEMLYHKKSSNQDNTETDNKKDMKSNRHDLSALSPPNTSSNYYQRVSSPDRNTPTMQWKQSKFAVTADVASVDSFLMDETTLNQFISPEALDRKIVQENLAFVNNDEVSNRSSASNFKSSSETIQRLRVLAERDVASMMDSDSVVEKGSVRSMNSLQSNSKVDRLQQIYMKVSNRNSSL